MTDNAVATNVARAICVRCSKLIDPYLGRALLSEQFPDSIVFEHLTERRCEEAQPLQLEPGAWKVDLGPRVPIQILRDRLEFLKGSRERILRDITTMTEDQQWRSILTAAYDLGELEAQIGVIEQMLAGEWKWRG